LSRDHGRGVNVELADLDPAFVLHVDLLDDGGDHAAGCAPLGPEVHQDRFRGLDYLGFEVQVGEVHQFRHILFFHLQGRVGFRAAAPGAAISI